MIRVPLFPTVALTTLACLASAPSLDAQPRVQGARPAEVRLSNDGRAVRVALRGSGLDQVRAIEVVEEGSGRTATAFRTRLLRASARSLELEVALDPRSRLSADGRWQLVLLHPHPRNRRQMARTGTREPAIAIGSSGATSRTSRVGPRRGRAPTGRQSATTAAPRIERVEPRADHYRIVGEGFEPGVEVRLDGERLAPMIYRVDSSELIEVQAACLPGGSHEHRVGDGDPFTAQHPDPVPDFEIAWQGTNYDGGIVFVFALQPMPPAECLDRMEVRLAEPGIDLGTPIVQNGQMRVSPPSTAPEGVYTLEVELMGRTATYAPAVIPGEASIVDLHVYDGPKAGLSTPWLLPPSNTPLVVYHDGAGFDRIDLVIAGRGSQWPVGDADGEIVVPLPSNLPPGGPYDVEVMLTAGGLPLDTRTFPDFLHILGRPSIETCGTELDSGDLVDEVFPGSRMVVTGEHLMAPAPYGLTPTVTVGDETWEMVPESSNAERLEVAVPSREPTNGYPSLSVSNGFLTNHSQDPLCFVRIPSPQLSDWSPKPVVVSPSASSVLVEAEGAWLGYLAESARIGNVEAVTVERLDPDRVRLHFPPTLATGRLHIETVVDRPPLESSEDVVVQATFTPQIDGLVTGVVTEGDPIRVVGNDLLPRDNVYMVRLGNEWSTYEGGSLIHATSTESELHFERGELVTGEVRLRYFRNDGLIDAHDLGTLYFVAPPEMSTPYLLAADATAGPGAPTNVGRQIKGDYLTLPPGDAVSVTVGGQPAPVLSVERRTDASTPYDIVTIELPNENGMTLERERTNWRTEVTVTTPYGSATHERALYYRRPMIDGVELVGVTLVVPLPDWSGTLYRGRPVEFCGVFSTNESGLEIRIGSVTAQAERFFHSGNESCARFTVPEGAQSGPLEITNPYGTTELGPAEVVDPTT